ncbi:hypothetical protein Tsubulata_043361 [Turnera subulata]|uniref:Uncharacterized protein n=1 Tax=Turnera subulata TaxID=218843 RepID=A0A9Q0JIL7_9ROSI|nr:hypothetical protein Tsubulata_043361 [Turnera subulata]
MVICCIEEESTVEARLACDELQRLLSRRLHLLSVDCGLLFRQDRVCTVAVVAGLCCSDSVFVKAEAVLVSFLCPALSSSAARLMAQRKRKPGDEEEDLNNMFKIV